MNERLFWRTRLERFKYDRRIGVDKPPFAEAIPAQRLEHQLESELLKGASLGSRWVACPVFMTASCS